MVDLVKQNFSMSSCKFDQTSEATYGADGKKELLDCLLTGGIWSLRQQNSSQKSIKINISNMQKIQQLSKTIINKVYIISCTK